MRVRVVVDRYVSIWMGRCMDERKTVFVREDLIIIGLCQNLR